MQVLKWEYTKLGSHFVFQQIVVPRLPSKAWKRQLPFRADKGIFDEDFIEERRKGLENFINKYVYLYICFFKHVFFLESHFY